MEHIAWFAAKVYFFLFLFVWIRATLPRLRYDQLMRFGWKVMLPIAGQHHHGHHRVFLSEGLKKYTVMAVTMMLASAIGNMTFQPNRIN